MRTSSLFAFVTAALIPQTHAWGSVGHEIVATVAEMHLHPSVLPKLCDILHSPQSVDGQCHLAPVAAWADRIRNQARYRWTGPLHYINAVDDYPRETCAFPGPQGWQGRTHINVLNGIRNTTNVLQEFVRLRNARSAHALDSEPEVPGYVQDALKFLIHFIGDMHQPLHLTGRNRGGNGDKVAFDGRSTNLHSVWDSLLISERIRTLPQNYTQPLPLPDIEQYLRDTIYDPYIRRLVWEGLLGKWQDELESWLICPLSSPSAQTRRQRESASRWQSILSFLPSTRKGEGEGEDGLGVDDDKLCPYAWAEQIHELDCRVVFPEGLDAAQSHDHFVRASEKNDDEDYEHDVTSDEWEEMIPRADDNDETLGSLKSRYFELYTPEYTGLIKEQWIVEKLLTQAGVRLAGVLNWIFAEPGEDEIERQYLTL